MADNADTRSFSIGDLETEELDLGWVARFSSATSGAHVHLVAGDATSRRDSTLSVHTDDVDAAHSEALELGYEMVNVAAHDH